MFPPSRFALPLISWLVKKVPFVKVIFRLLLSYDAPVKAFPLFGTSTLVAPVSVLASSLQAGLPLASVFQTLFAWPAPEATYPSEEELFAFHVLVSVALIVISPEAAEIETLVPGLKFRVLSAFCVNLTASVLLPLICK